MIVENALGDARLPNEVLEGNVYPVRGGRGSREGHMQIIIALTPDRMCAVLVVDKEGTIRGATSYAVHYFEEKMPIAVCDGLNDIRLIIRPLI